MPSAKQMWKLVYNNLQMVIIVFLAKLSTLQIDTKATPPATTQI